MKKYYLFIIAFSLTLASPIYASEPEGTMQFIGDFETGDLSVWRFSGNDTTYVVDSPVRNGNYAAYMEVTPDDEIPYRSELVVREGKGGFEDGQEYWIGFSYRMEDWGIPLPAWSTIMQIHSIPHTLPGENNANWNCTASKNPISVTTNKDLMALHVVADPDQSLIPKGGAIATKVWSEQYTLHKWYDWVFRFIPSTESDGVIEAWVDGEKIYSYTGATRFILDACNLPGTPTTYLKVGIYREKEITSTQKLNYDEVRIFAGKNGYSMVAPPTNETNLGDNTNREELEQKIILLKKLIELLNIMIKLQHG